MGLLEFLLLGGIAGQLIYIGSQLEKIHKHVAEIRGEIWQANRRAEMGS